jgi:hypothetical protein
MAGLGRVRASAHLGARRSTTRVIWEPEWQKRPRQRSRLTFVRPPTRRSQGRSNVGAQAATHGRTALAQRPLPPLRRAGK